MSGKWFFTIEVPATPEWFQHLREREAGPGFPIPMFDFGLVYPSAQPYRMQVFSKGLHRNRQCWIPNGKIIVPLELDAMLRRGWRPQYAEIGLPSGDPRFEEFFRLWIKHCCSILTDDIATACQRMGQNPYIPVEHSHTLMLAPVGVTYLLTVSATDGLFIETIMSREDPNFAKSKENAAKILRIAQPRLAAISTVFRQKYRDFAPVHYAARRAPR